MCWGTLLQTGITRMTRRLNFKVRRLDVHTQQQGVILKEVASQCCCHLMQFTVLFWKPNRCYAVIRSSSCGVLLSAWASCIISPVVLKEVEFEKSTLMMLLIVFLGFFCISCWAWRFQRSDGLSDGQHTISVYRLWNFFRSMISWKIGPQTSRFCCFITETV